MTTAQPTKVERMTTTDISTVRPIEQWIQDTPSPSSWPARA